MGKVVVVSGTLRSPAWNNSTVIGLGDLPQLKAHHGGLDESAFAIAEERRSSEVVLLTLHPKASA
jgi:hypothetical protein